MYQEHSGTGDNVGRDKVVKIEQQIVYYSSKREVPRLLTKLPKLSDVIIGRQEELNVLYETLENSQRIVLMNGMGGVGKTTLATAFVNRYQKHYVHPRPLTPPMSLEPLLPLKPRTPLRLARPVMIRDPGAAPAGPSRASC